MPKRNKAPQCQLKLSNVEIALSDRICAFWFAKLYVDSLRPSCTREKNVNFSQIANLRKRLAGFGQVVLSNLVNASVFEESPCAFETANA